MAWSNIILVILSLPDARRFSARSTFHRQIDAEHRSSVWPPVGHPDFTPVVFYYLVHDGQA